MDWAKATATLVLFIISIVFVIHRVDVPVPYLGRKFPISLTTAPIVAILLLWAAQCIGATVIRDGIVGTEGVKPYNILILFFSLAYMSITLDVTGILQSAAYWVSNKGGNSGWKLFCYFYVMLTLISVVIGNDPVILSGTAFLVYYTRAVDELKPLPWLISEFAAANTASMVLFVGNPTNVVICEGFGVQNAAFTAYTILPFLACSIGCFIALAFQYRSAKYIPRRITATKLDVRAVLLDPVSAWFGSILLVSCLVVILVVSFFEPKIDVWMIVLPFAVVKFVYDLVWDHIRYERGIPMLGRGQSDPEKIIRAGSPRSPPTGVVSEPEISHPTTDGHSLNGAPNPQATERNELSPEQDPSTSQTPSPSSTLPVATELPTCLKTIGERSLTVFEIIKGPSPVFSKGVRERFPTFFKALPRLPFALVPFAFSQFILIEALASQGWIDVFAKWLIRATHLRIYPTIWVIGVLGVILCNTSGTNIGATILLTKVVRAANMPTHTLRAAAIALAVASNIGAVSFTFSASLAGLLWKTILNQKGIPCRQRDFAMWNLLPLTAMTAVGLSVVSAEMAVLYGGNVS